MSAGTSNAVLHGRDVVCISSIDWDFIWQGHQQIMSTLAAQGNRVLFIENTGVRPPRLRDLSRLRHRVARWWSSTQGFREERKNLFIFSPLIVPLPYSRVARWINRTLLLRAIRRWMRVVGFARPVVWTFLPTPLARDLMTALDPEITVYYCIDDLASSSRAARKIEKTEQKVFREADLVFVTSEKLRQRAARFSSRVHLFPFAVDYPAFEAVREEDGGLPADLASLTGPRIGYLGGIHQWVDQALLVDVARRMPQVTFAMIGPVQADVSLLAACPNVRLLGARSHSEVPRYLKGFDVGIVPYRLSDYTAHVYPTKLNEYLAMGLPVVTTDLPEIRRFNAEHGEIIMVAKDADGFAAALRAVLRKASPAEVERRINVARRNGWERRIAEMSRLIESEAAERPHIEGSWEDTLRRMYRGTKRRLVRTAAATVFLYGLAFWSPLPWIAAAPLRLDAPPTRADAIVVLAGGVGESGMGGQGYQERVQKAVQLYQSGYAEQIVFSTGWTYTFHEADLMRALAISLGVPAQAIILEKKAGSTYENAQFVRAIAEPLGWKRILLVSSPYHMRRALLTFRKQAPRLEVVPTPAASGFYDHQGGASAEQIRGLVHEYLGIIAYWWWGRI